MLLIFLFFINLEYINIEHRSSDTTEQTIQTPSCARTRDTKQRLLASTRPYDRPKCPSPRDPSPRPASPLISPRGARERPATRPARRRRWLPPTRPRPPPPPPRSAPPPHPCRRTLTSSAASYSHRPPPRPAPTPITLPSAASFSAASPPPPFSTEWYVGVPPLLRSPRSYRI